VGIDKYLSSHINIEMSEGEERYEEYERKFFPSGFERNVFIDPVKGRYVGVQPHDPLYVNPTRLVEDLRHQVYDNYITTDSYIASSEVIVIDYERTLLWLKNHHGTNTILYGVEATVNTDDWEILLEDEPLEPGESDYQYLIQPWYRVRLIVKSKNAGQPGLIEGFINRR